MKQMLACPNILKPANKADSKTFVWKLFKCFARKIQSLEVRCSTPTLDFCPHGKQLLSGHRSVGPDFFLVRHLLNRQIQLGPLMTGTMKQTLLHVLTGVLHARDILE